MADEVIDDAPAIDAVQSVDTTEDFQDADVASGLGGHPSGLIETAPPSGEGTPALAAADENPWANDPKYLEAIEKSRRYDGVDSIIDKYGADAAAKILSSILPNYEAAGNDVDALLDSARKVQESEEVLAQRQDAEMEREFSAKLAKDVQDTVWTTAQADAHKEAADYAAQYERQYGVAPDIDPTFLQKRSEELYYKAYQGLHGSMSTLHEQRKVEYARIATDPNLAYANKTIMREVLYAPNLKPEQVRHYAQVTHEATAKAIAPYARQVEALKAQIAAKDAAITAAADKARLEGQVSANKALADSQKRAPHVEGGGSRAAVPVGRNGHGHREKTLDEILAGA